MEFSFADKKCWLESLRGFSFFSDSVAQGYVVELKIKLCVTLYFICDEGIITVTLKPATLPVGALLQSSLQRILRTYT